MRHALSQSHLLLDFKFILGFFLGKFEEIYGLDFFFPLKDLNYGFVDKFVVVVWAI